MLGYGLWHWVHGLPHVLGLGGQSMGTGWWPSARTAAWKSGCFNLTNMQITTGKLIDYHKLLSWYFFAPFMTLINCYGFRCWLDGSEQCLSTSYVAGETAPWTGRALRRLKPGKPRKKTWEFQGGVSVYCHSWVPSFDGYNDIILI